MRTEITVETDDRVRYIIGTQITGYMHKATREQVRAYFQVIFDNEVVVLEKKADELVAKVIANLDNPPLPLQDGGGEK